MVVEAKQEKDGSRTAGNAGPMAGLAEVSAKLVAGQTAMLTAMTLVGMNMASQMTGAFFQAFNKPEDKVETEPSAAAPNIAAAEVGEKDNVVPLRAAAKKKTRVPPKDDLKKIVGIGPRLEKVLNDRGIVRYADLLALSEAELMMIDGELGLDGRVIRDNWASQAEKLAKTKG